MKRMNTHVPAVALATVGAFVLVSGVAYAAWTTTGSGSGTAQARTFQAITVVAGTAPAGQLYPGLTANGTTTGGDLVVTATNPNPFSVTVSVTGGTATGCATTGVTILGTPSFALAANANAVSTTIAKVVSMSTASTSDCQGVTITIPLTTSSVSS